jgi:transketolase
VIPDEIYQGFDATERGLKAEQAWNDLFHAYQKKYPELAAEFARRKAGQLPQTWQDHAKNLIQTMDKKRETIATRKASQQCIQHFAAILPEFMGGSAERNAVRLSAMMQAHVIFVYTHDSIGLGEDGPTHQPIEHIASLRCIPNLSLWRPCDTVETAVAWQHAIEHKRAHCLILSRQNLPYMERTPAVINNIARGGYILSDCNGSPDLIMMATGSEVSLAVLAAKELTALGRQVRVVSMPSTNVFLQQDKAYQEEVLPQAIEHRLAIEAASPDGWYAFVGSQGRVLGLNHFGASAPAKEVFKEFGFTVQNVVSVANDMLTL